MATIAVLLTQPPYGQQRSADGIEFALASTNYGHECHVIFCAEGVYQLLNNQAPAQQKNHLKQTNVLPFYDIDPIYVCERSMASLRIAPEDLGVNDVEVLSADAMHTLISRCDHTVTF
ncbi:DsrE family protein [Alteromonas gilva]|uniref:DsrE family protein n=1 Tax=Alteromonas gilva TaxID=2987522 RepID=A0ABT5L3W5_9ALTE|nr:DsrE family protein [Alteromonas gilva]MDC8831129.1 DsrE family protein [Alteromonas gilva]